jgi:hypothetical protein
VEERTSHTHQSDTGLVAFLPIEIVNSLFLLATVETQESLSSD